MAHHSDITSDLDSDIVDSDDDEDNEEFTTFRGPWFNVVDPNSFIMPDPDFREETGPVSFYPGMLNRDVCVDERIVGFKGRHQLKQYISNKKAHRWGIKLWVLSDSTSGYTHHLNIYKGRRNERRSPNGQGYQAVMDLMEPHFYKEHHITFDSFFTSPKLVYDLLDKQTHSTGTVIKSRKDMPSSFKNAIMQKGDVKVKTRAGVMAVQWADRRVVSLLTTTGSARQIQTTNGKGREVSIPAIIDTYNLAMGGVDLGDQLILQFEPQFKSLKMWRKLLFHSLVTAAVYAYICYRDSFIVQYKMDHLKFHQQLCQELTGGFRQGSRNRQLRIIPVQHRTLARLSERHFPSKIPDGNRKRCAVCAGHGGGFRKTRIPWWCEDCRVGLCVEGCFRKFHTRINFEE
ncbi:piggyBac transposable element-derived protein 4-like [Saccostrea echinata]|uniref:piggyBac transposable element-derived protein 4-like n=1 Tax=Saccostrea echinata TaxID=191078 RepID=UPI002A83A9E4|nr:piggyBac transposable element-derived protein 4-like [Saccostrea echinata]